MNVKWYWVHVVGRRAGGSYMPEDDVSAESQHTSKVHHGAIGSLVYENGSFERLSKCTSTQTQLN